MRRFGVGEMAAGVAETPVELDVTGRPTANVVRAASWIELRLRYPVHPRRGTRPRNALYRSIIDRFNDNPAGWPFQSGGIGRTVASPVDRFPDTGNRRRRLSTVTHHTYV